MSEPRIDKIYRQLKGLREDCTFINYQFNLLKVRLDGLNDLKKELDFLIKTIEDNNAKKTK